MRELLPVPRTPDLHLLRRLRNGLAISSVIPTNYTPIPIKYDLRALAARFVLARTAAREGRPLFHRILLSNPRIKPVEPIDRYHRHVALSS